MFARAYSEKMSCASSSELVCAGPPVVWALADLVPAVKAKSLSATVKKVYGLCF